MTDVTTSNVGEKLKTLFTTLIEKISTLTFFVNGVSRLTSDMIVQKSEIKTNTIFALLDSKVEKYNIAYIDTKFGDILSGYTKIKNTNSEFFKGFLGVDGNLDAKMDSMVQFIK